MDGTGKVQLTNNIADDSCPRWIPDGLQILFMSNSDGNYEVYIMDADGSNQKNLSNHPAMYADPDISTADNTLIFASHPRYSSGEYDLFTANADGMNVTAHPSDSYADDVVPRFSPDGAKIVFVYLREGYREIFIIDADRSNVTQLTDDNSWKTIAPDCFPDQGHWRYWLPRHHQPLDQGSHQY